jgi:hypothetical protein
MRILPVIARLKAQCALLANRVEPAKSLTQLSDEEIKTGLPIAFVYAFKDGASPSELINKTSQRVSKRFTVIIAAKTSDAVSEPIEDVRDQIKAALIGWEPSATHDPVEFIGGEIVNITGGVTWWKDTYETLTYNRS